MLAGIGQRSSRSSRSTAPIGVSPSPNGRLGPSIAFPVLDVQRHDASMMCAQKIHGIEIGRGEVADVEIDRDEGAQPSWPREVLGRRKLVGVDARVIVHPDRESCGAPRRARRARRPGIRRSCDACGAERLASSRSRARSRASAEVILEADVVGRDGIPARSNLLLDAPETRRARRSRASAAARRVASARLDVSLPQLATA